MIFGVYIIPTGALNVGYVAVGELYAVQTAPL